VRKKNNSNCHSDHDRTVASHNDNVTLQPRTPSVSSTSLSASRLKVSKIKVKAEVKNDDHLHSITPQSMAKELNATSISSTTPQNRNSNHYSNWVHKHIHVHRVEKSKLTLIQREIHLIGQKQKNPGLCCICIEPEDDDDPIISCSGYNCGVVVHLDCYGLSSSPSLSSKGKRSRKANNAENKITPETWLCDRCQTHDPSLAVCYTYSLKSKCRRMLTNYALAFSLTEMRPLPFSRRCPS
jgi:hypothetical protein